MTRDLIDEHVKIIGINNVFLRSEGTYHSIRFKQLYPLGVISVHVNRCIFIFNEYYLCVYHKEFRIGRSEYLAFRDKIKCLIEKQTK